MAASVAVVFGGSRGIGRAVALKFIQNKLNVVILSRNDKNIKEALSFLRPKLNSEEQKLEGLNCDVNDEESIKKCHTFIEENVGSADIIVNSVGININRLLIQTSGNDTTSLIDSNLISSMNICRLFLKSMMRKKSGSIVNIGSIVGLKGNVGQTLYSASKSGLVGFTKSLAKEVASRNITVNLIIPGFVETDMTSNVDYEQIKPYIPLRRIGTPGEIAEAVYFLATSPFITGEVLVVDGGLQLTL